MRAGGRTVDGALRLGVFLSFFSVGCSAILVLGYMEYVSFTAIVLCALLAYTVGYLLQSATCALLRHKRSDDVGTYESNERLFRVVYLIPSVILTAALFFVCMKVVNGYLLDLSESAEGAYYDPESLVPFLVSVCVPPMAIVGSVAWFIPTGRAFSIKFVSVEFTLLLIFGIATGFTLWSVILTALFSAVALFGVNQTAISKKPLGTVVTTLTRRARWTNVSICFAFLTAAVVLTFAFVMIFTGFTTLFTLIFASLFIAHENGESEYYDQPDLGSRVGETIRKNTGIGQGWLITLLSVICFIAFFMAVVIVAFRKTKEIKSFLNKVKEYIVEMLRAVMFFIAIERRERRLAELEKNENLTFVDNEKKIQQAVINPYAQAARKVASYKDFEARLRKFGRSDEKLMFAYVTMVSVMKKKYPFIRPSDTPREIGAKIKANSNIEDIAGITEAFEVAAYSMSSERDYDGATKAICRVLMANMA